MAGTSARVAMICLGAVAAMFAVFTVVHATFPDGWRPVEAEVCESAWNIGSDSLLVQHWPAHALISLA